MDARLGDRGQVLPLVAFLVFFAAVVMVAMGAVGRAAVQRSQARTAADAAALAAAGADRETALEVARRNGGQLTNVYEQADDQYRVTLLVGEAIGAATAQRVDPPPLEGSGTRAGLAPAMLAALARADELLGTRVPVSSGYRSIEHQQRLWDRRHTNPYPVARPGRSRHQSGLAVDVPPAFVPRLLTVASRAGLCRPLPERDPVHFELCG